MHTAPPTQSSYEQRDWGDELGSFHLGPDNEELFLGRLQSYVVGCVSVSAIKTVVQRVMQQL